MSRPNLADNMLESFTSAEQGTAMQITSFFFAIFIVGLGIPLLSVLCRLNLTGSGFSTLVGHVFAVYLPFGFSWLFYRGAMVTLILTWGGILFTSLVAFLFPIFLAIRALEVSDNPGSIFGNHRTEHKKNTLQCLLIISIVVVLASIIENLRWITESRNAVSWMSNINVKNSRHTSRTAHTVLTLPNLLNSFLTPVTFRDISSSCC